MKDVDEIRRDLMEQVALLLDLPIGEVDTDVPLLELGADSLVIVEIIRHVESRFGVKLTVRHLFEEFVTVDALSEHVASVSKPKEQPTKKPQARGKAAPRLTSAKARFIEDLAKRHVERTKRSREIARGHRAACGSSPWWPTLEPELSEASHPIYVDRSRGGRLWDVDGNELVDLSMGFGCHLFGHSPPFVTDALAEQLDRGSAIGPANLHTAEVARLVSELTGMERVTFANSGTEAVMTALRLARAATGRSKVVLFRGSDHGRSEAALASQGEVPVDGVAQDILLLEHGAIAELARIEEIGAEIAAVLVEPIRQSALDLESRAFLGKLRELTRDHGIVLIFDEFVTGFRLHPSGAQGWFGIDADVALYGGLLADGLPVGAIAGVPEVLDRVDGGFRERFDLPGVEMTFTAGTYCKNPLSMAAAHAVLGELWRTGPELQTSLNRRASELAQVIGPVLDDAAIGIRMTQVGSMLRFVSDATVNGKLALESFLIALSHHGVLAPSNGACFLSTAHDDDDLNRIVDAVEDASRELRAGGFGV